MEDSIDDLPDGVLEGRTLGETLEGRVLEGRTLKSRVLKNRVLDGDVPENDYLTQDNSGTTVGHGPPELESDNGFHPLINPENSNNNYFNQK
jgi:hypothetical protein